MDNFDLGAKFGDSPDCASYDFERRVAAPGRKWTPMHLPSWRWQREGPQPGERGFPSSPAAKRGLSLDAGI